MSSRGDDVNNFTIRPSKLRSRVRSAEVIAFAREISAKEGEFERNGHQAFTLKDPSRPKTPASYDERTMVNIDSLQGYQPAYGGRSAASAGMMKLTANLLERKDKNMSSKKPLLEDKMVLPMKDDPLSTVSHQSLNLFLRDLEDTIGVLESEINSLAVLVQENSKLNEIIVSLAPMVERMAKLMKDRSSKEVSYQSNELSKNLLRILAEASSTSSSRQHQPSRLESLSLCSVYLLKLNLPSLRPATESLAPGSRRASHPDITPEISEAIRQSCQFLYELSFDLNTSVDDSASSADNFVSGEMDQIFAFLGLFLERFSYDFTREITQSSSTSFMNLLEAMLCACGVIRSFSLELKNRKRLSKLGVVELMCRGMNIINSSFNTHLSTASSPTPSMIGRQLAKIFVQITATFRNFSLDQTGRDQLLESKVVSPLCTALRLFRREDADLAFSVLRVTAKLSLYEDFRVQMNQSKGNHIKCIVDVIIQEAKSCSEAVNNEDVENDIASWPSWQTWPILSRAAFTLGNLTTSNNPNRFVCQVT